MLVYKLSGFGLVSCCSHSKISASAFLDSQFKYCVLIWICYSDTNNRICNGNDNQSSFKESREKNSSISIHKRNVQMLVPEMYKFGSG